MTDDVQDVYECPLCGSDARGRDPFTESKLCFSSGVQETPCGKKYRRWVHMGCAQEKMRRDGA